MMRARFFSFLLITGCTSKNHTVELQLHGLLEPVKVLRDKHDISHIYGDKRSPFYNKLFERWANDVHCTLYFSKGKVEQTAAERILLIPNAH